METNLQYKWVGCHIYRVGDVLKSLSGKYPYGVQFITGGSIFSSERIIGEDVLALGKIKKPSWTGNSGYTNSFEITKLFTSKTDFNYFIVSQGYTSNALSFAIINRLEGAVSHLIDGNYLDVGEGQWCDWYDCPFGDYRTICDIVAESGSAEVSEIVHRHLKRKGLECCCSRPLPFYDDIPADPRKIAEDIFYSKEKKSISKKLIDDHRLTPDFLESVFSELIDVAKMNFIPCK